MLQTSVRGLNFRGFVLSRFRDSSRGVLGATGEGGYDECWAAICEKIKVMEPLFMKCRQADGQYVDPHHARLPSIDGVEPRKE
jgi:hypothetical protein